MFCFRVKLEPSYCGSTSAWVGQPRDAGTIGAGRFVDVDKHGQVYVVAEALQYVAEEYPNATEIVLMGIGYYVD